jgi:hypothetical protein
MTNDFEAELRSSLAAIPATPSHDLAQAANEGHHHRKGQRRKATRALMAAVPAAALIVGGAAVAAHGTGTASPVATHPAVLTADYVKQKVETTLSSTNDIVEVTGNGFVFLHSAGSSINPVNYVVTSGTYAVTAWTDPVTGNLQTVIKSPTDVVTTWTTSHEVGKQVSQKSVTVDAATKTASISAGVLSPGELPASGYASPQQLKEALATGQLTITNKSAIDGQSAVDLHVRNVNGSTLDLWVNTRTFQLVKLVEPLTSAVTVTDYYHYLPRTKSLVDQVSTPQIPAGYRQVGTSK